MGRIVWIFDYSLIVLMRLQIVKRVSIINAVWYTDESRMSHKLSILYKPASIAFDYSASEIPVFMWYYYLNLISSSIRC